MAPNFRKEFSTRGTRTLTALKTLLHNNDQHQDLDTTIPDDDSDIVEYAYDGCKTAEDVIRLTEQNEKLCRDMEALHGKIEVMETIKEEAQAAQSSAQCQLLTCQESKRVLENQIEQKGSYIKALEARIETLLEDKDELQHELSLMQGLLDENSRKLEGKDSIMKLQEGKLDELQRDIILSKEGYERELKEMNAAHALQTEQLYQLENLVATLQDEKREHHKERDIALENLSNTLEQDHQAIIEKKEAAMAVLEESIGALREETAGLLCEQEAVQLQHGKAIQALKKEMQEMHASELKAKNSVIDEQEKNIAKMQEEHSEAMEALKKSLLHEKETEIRALKHLSGEQKSKMVYMAKENREALESLKTKLKQEHNASFSATEATVAAYQQGMTSMQDQVSKLLKEKKEGLIEQEEQMRDLETRLTLEKVAAVRIRDRKLKAQQETIAKLKAQVMENSREQPPVSPSPSPPPPLLTSTELPWENGADNREPPSPLRARPSTKVVLLPNHAAYNDDDDVSEITTALIEAVNLSPTRKNVRAKPKRLLSIRPTLSKPNILQKRKPTAVSPLPRSSSTSPSTGSSSSDRENQDDDCTLWA